MQKRKFILFLTVFLIVFRVLGKNSNLRGRKRFTRSLKITLILIFECLNPTEANANQGQGIIPGAHGFTPQPQNPLLGPRNRNPMNPMNPNPNLTKPPRLPSGFTKIPHTVVKGQPGNGGNGNGNGGNGNGNGNGKGNPKNPRSKSPDRNLNQEYYEKKKKKKKRSDEISKERVIEAYRDFLSKMKQKGYEIDVSKTRFMELCINSTTGVYDEKSLFEAEGGLQLEAQGMIRNLRRPENPEVKLDFMAERVDSGDTIFIDHKGMIDFKFLSDQGKEISGFPSHEQVAFNMGKDSIKQKRLYLGMEKGPTSMEEVLHLYNFEKIRNTTEKPILVQAVRNGAEQAGYVDGMIFLNHE